MCKCTPSIRTPFCGKLGCQWPAQQSRDSKGFENLRLNGPLRDLRGGLIELEIPMSDLMAYEHAWIDGELIRLPNGNYSVESWWARTPVSLTVDIYLRRI